MMGAATKSSVADRVVGAVHSVVGCRHAELHEPRFVGNEWQYVKACLDSSFVSSVGPFVERFESELAAYLGAKYAVAVVSGTAALHVALRIAGVLPGDEVLVPTLTFVATANAVAYCGAIPHLLDSETRTLGVDAVALREHLRSSTEVRDQHCVNRLTGRVIRAIVPMHVFGHPCDIEAIMAVADEFRLVVIEDAAESLGSKVGARYTGTIGAMGTLSFNGNKTITTGGGGALVTNDRVLALRAKHLTTTAKVPHPWEYRHDEVGYNYRMPNINAALGCAQLEQLPGYLRAKRRLFELYRAAFDGSGDLCMLAEPHNCTSNYWLQTLILDATVADQRDAVLAATHRAGLMTRPAWIPMHQLRPFEHCPRMTLHVAESLESRIINLPSSPQLLSLEQLE